MFGSLKQFFDEKLAPAAAVSEEERLQVATCALLLEVAHADDDYSEDEVQTVMAVVGRRFGLSAAETSGLLAVADEERRRSGDLYQFARLVNDSYTRERKLAIVELLWRVVYSDGVLESHEDALMHKLGTLLGVRLDELMALKVQVKRDLGL
ncbi:TerB family tellurite resistance protein [bacterium]|nr:TerB family tellurite resistance protein [bacterium]